MKKVKFSYLFILILFNILIFIIISPFVIFYGNFHNLKLFVVCSILNSRHPQIVELFLSQKEIDSILNSYTQKRIDIEPVIRKKGQVFEDKKNQITIEKIEGKYFKGFVMLIENPLRIKVAVTNEIGTAGQRLTELVSATGALAGINGGGFYDPNAQGNGAFPEGITVQNGEVVHNNVGFQSVNIIGFNDIGQLILKNMNQAEIYKQKIQNAVTFGPYLIVNGKPLIKGDGGWGIAPRTGIGQKADGTVIFVVIDGRQPGWSMGATLRDLMNIFLEYGAVNAANLDGGSSAEMVYKGKIINSLWNIYGERYIPTAFIVVPDN